MDIVFLSPRNICIMSFLSIWSSSYIHNREAVRKVFLSGHIFSSHYRSLCFSLTVKIINGKRWVFMGAHCYSLCITCQHRLRLKVVFTSFKTRYYSQYKIRVYVFMSGGGSILWRRTVREGNGITLLQKITRVHNLIKYWKVKARHSLKFKGILKFVI